MASHHAARSDQQTHCAGHAEAGRMVRDVGQQRIQVAPAGVRAQRRALEHEVDHLVACGRAVEQEPEPADAEDHEREQRQQRVVGDRRSALRATVLEELAQRASRKRARERRRPGHASDLPIARAARARRVRRLTSAPRPYSRDRRWTTLPQSPERVAALARVRRRRRRSCGDRRRDGHRRRERGRPSLPRAAAPRPRRPAPPGRRCARRRSRAPAARRRVGRRHAQDVRKVIRARVGRLSFDVRAVFAGGGEQHAGRGGERVALGARGRGHGEREVHSALPRVLRARRPRSRPRSAAPFGPSTAQRNHARRPGDAGDADPVVAASGGDARHERDLPRRVLVVKIAVLVDEVPARGGVPGEVGMVEIGYPGGAADAVRGAASRPPPPRAGRDGLEAGDREAGAGCRAVSRRTLQAGKRSASARSRPSPAATRRARACRRTAGRDLHSPAARDRAAAQASMVSGGDRLPEPAVGPRQVGRDLVVSPVPARRARR